MGVIRKCTVIDCHRKYAAKGYCAAHYRRYRRYGDPRIDIPVKEYVSEWRSCEFSDCNKPRVSHGLCNGHSHQRRRGIELRPLALPGTSGRKNRGQGWIDDEGYRCRLLDGRQVRDHRLVMERHLGRALLPGETVHHGNGVRSDNRLSNLELWCSSHPAGQRVEDLVQWAKEILERYA